MLAEERRQRMVEMVAENDTVSVTEFATSSTPPSPRFAATSIASRAPACS